MSRATLKQAFVLSSAALMLLACCPFAAAQTVEYTDVPIDSRVYARDVSSNTATVDISGRVVSGGYDTALVVSYRDGAPLSTQTQALAYSGGSTGATLTVTSGLQLWLDASTGVETDGGNAVTNWLDQSGLSRHARVVATNDQPALDNDAVYGRPAIQFNGSNDSYFVSGTTADWTFLHNGSGVTAFVVYYDSTSDLGTLLGSGASATANVGFHTGPRNSSDEGLYFSIGRGVGGSTVFTENHSTRSDGDFPKNTWGIYAHSYSETSTPAEIQVWNNGVESFSADTTQDPSGDNSTSNLCVGADRNVFRLTGYIAEVILYDRVLSDGERGEVENYLNDKYFSPTNAPFAFTQEITAELVGYEFDVSLVQGVTTTLVASATNVVAGDVYLVNGQSNAEARERTGSANANQGPFLRSFGINANGAATVQGDLNWYMAEGDEGMNNGSGNIGQWAIRMGRNLVDTYSIPVAILNAGDGGEAIGFFQRNDSDHDNLASNYGRLLYRAQEAGVVDGVRSILWYQGESDNNDAATHEAGFVSLYDDWNEDYPNVERYYVCQLRTGCGVTKELVDLRNRQRLLADTYADLDVMSTTGLNSHDGCHFDYVDGYDLLGANLFNLVARDLFASSNTNNITPPNIDSAYFSRTDKTEITLVMRNEDDALTFDSGAEADFILEGSSETVTSGTVSSNTLVLTLSESANTATGVTYSGHSGAGAWVTNANGVGMLTFYDEPIATVALPAPTIENQPASLIEATAATLNGNLVSTGESASVVLLYWGASDGGTDPFSWDESALLGPSPEGSISNEVVTLAGSTTYYYRYYATNDHGDAWAPTVESFVTLADLGDWTYKTKITLGGYDKGETLTDFPVLVVLNEDIPGFSYDQFASANGSDLRFGDSTETVLLNYEVEEWNPDGNSLVWVQVPQLVDSSTYIYAYWGNDDVIDETLPNELADLQLWLKADAGVETDAASGLVTNWVDQSGNANDVAQGTAADQPTNVASVVNGEPVLRFAGGDRLLSADDSTFNFLHNGLGNTVFVLFRAEDQGNTLQWVLDTGANTSGNVGISLGVEDRSGDEDRLWFSIVAGGNNIINTDNAAYNNTMPHDEWLLVALGFESGAPGNDVQLDRSAVNIVDFEPSNAPSAANSTRTLSIGARGDNGSLFLEGDVAEVIMYDRVLTAEEENAIGFYLQTKYGLSGRYTDPSAHPGSAWDSDYVGVWHVNEEVADESKNAIHFDSTVNENDGLQRGNTDTPAIVADGQNMDGNDYIIIGDVMPAAAYTKSVWVKRESDTTANILSGDSSHVLWAPATYGHQLSAGHDGTWNYVQDPVALTSGEWFHVAVSYDPAVYGGEMTLFKNGEVVDSATNVPVQTDSAVSYISRFSSGNYWNGDVDEVRLSSAARGSNWVCATYLMTASNDTFASYDDVDGSVTPLINNDAGADNITEASADLNGELTWTGASPTEVTVFWGGSDGGTDPLSWDDLFELGVRDMGALSTNLTGLSDGTTYYYRYYATNDAGEAWADMTAEFTTDATEPEITNDGGASDILATSATLNGDLVSTGGAATAVSVYWGTEDAGTEETNWTSSANFGDRDIGALSTNVTGLSGDTLYYYRYYATNAFGEAWAGPSETFTTLSDFNDFTFNSKLTFTGYDKDETLTNFPMLVVLGSTVAGWDYGQFESDSGGDLRFSSGDETQTLNYEIESWDTNGDSYVWVQVPLLTNGACIIAHWGNATATNPPAYATDGSTWESAYQAVWHLDETAGTHFDATANGLDGTPIDGVVQDATGVIDGGNTFDGVDDSVQSAPSVLGSGFTEVSLHGWFKTASVSGGRNMSNVKGAYLIRAVSGDWLSALDGSTGNGFLSIDLSLNDDVWHHYVATHKGGTTLVYIDGTEVSGGYAESLHSLSGLEARPFAIGSDWDTTGNHWDGGLDEFRMSDVQRSSNWVWTCYMNQMPGSTFTDYGGVQGLTVPVISNDGGVSNVVCSAADLNGYLVATGTSATAVSVYWGPSDEGTVRTNRANAEVFAGFQDAGTLFTTNVTGLIGETTYYYRYYATNDTGEGWAPSSESFVAVRTRPTINNNGGASNVTETTAILNGDLVATGCAPTEVFAYWGASDGGTDPLSWDDFEDLGFQTPGLLMAPLAGLTENSTYHYRFYATNAFGEAWADSTETLQTLLTLTPTQEKLKITFSGYGPDEALTNFPALVVLNEGLSNFSYRNFFSHDGADLRFFDETETVELNYEIEEWDVNGDSFAWVQVPLLTNGACIYAKWGDPAATNVPAYTTDGSTWESNFKGVWHMTETDAQDSTAGANHGSGVNNTDADGIISGGQDFDGSTAFIDLSAHATDVGFVAPATISFWMRPLRDALSGGYNAPWSISNFDIGLDGLTGGLANEQIDIEQAGNLMAYTSATKLWDATNPSWRHVMVVLDGVETRLFFDGQELPLTTRGGDTDSGAYASGTPTIARMAQSYLGDNKYEGRLDEVRVTCIDRGSNWVWATYANVASNDTFAAYGEAMGDGGGPADEDGDGIPDDWELANCGSTTGCTATAQTGDGDGLTYGEEYVLDYNPAVSNKVFVISEAGLGSFNVTFGETTNSRVYTVDGTSDLIDSNGWVVIESAVTGSNGVTTVTDPGVSDHREYRIRAHVP